MNRKYKLTNSCYHGNQTASFRIFKKKRKQIGLSFSIISCEQGGMWMLLNCIRSIDTCLKHITNNRFLAITAVIWKSLWPKENFKNLAWYEMHLISKMFYFCFYGNHSHNLRLKVYLVVSLVISYVKKIISVNTFYRNRNML
jgi:hypothetical protein